MCEKLKDPLKKGPLVIQGIIQGIYIYMESHYLVIPEIIS